MKYGYFDVENREYVITRPDTPTPWINYLGSGGFEVLYQIMVADYCLTEIPEKEG